MSETTVWPDATDTDLWELIRKDLQEQYDDRFTEEQLRTAFEITCEYFDDYVPLARFIKKARMNCVWGRPIITKEQLARD